VPEIETIRHFGANSVIVRSSFWMTMPISVFSLQHKAWNAWAKQNGVSILSLPTGQGLLVKTPG
jgi:hypothetical protein